MRTFILFAALFVMAPTCIFTRPVLAAAVDPAPKAKPQPANIYNSPFGSTSISRGFIDRHFEMRRKVDTNKQKPAPIPVNDQGRVMRGA